MHKLAKTLSQGLILLLLVMGGVVMLAPFWWVLVGSFRSIVATFGSAAPQWWFTSFDLDNYRQVFQKIPIFNYMFNSFRIASIIVVGQLITGSMAGYAFARLRFPGRNQLFSIMLAPMMIPPQVTIIPLFIMMRYLGWIDDPKSLIVPFLASDFGVFLMRQNFKAIPAELEDAARIDGANEFQIFGLIMMPLVKPGLVSFAIFTFMYYWNDYFRPLIFISSQEKMTLPLGLAFLKGYMGLGSDAWLLAAISIAVIPLIIVFLFAQRSFIEGITMTGLKEG